MAEHDEEIAQEHIVREAEMQAALRHMLGHQAARRYVWELLIGFGLYHGCFAAGDPYLTAYREGLRGTALQMADNMRTYAPALWRAMQDENEREGKT